jgi:hypothetical protein
LGREGVGPPSPGMSGPLAACRSWQSLEAAATASRVNSFSVFRKILTTYLLIYIIICIYVLYVLYYYKFFLFLCQVIFLIVTGETALTFKYHWLSSGFYFESTRYGGDS